MIGKSFGKNDILKSVGGALARIPIERWQMYTRFLFTIGVIAATAIPVHAQSRRANMVRGGNPDRGKCTIEVVVDGVAEIEIHGDSATLRNVSGQQPQWRRFECNSPLPPNPVDFRFSGVDGRGRQELVRDPREGGLAVVQIEDPQAGSEGYTFDLTWSNAGGVSNGRDPRYDQRNDPRNEPNPGNDRGGDRNGNRRFPVDQALRICQDAIRQQAADRFRGAELTFRRIAMDDNPDRRDYVTGILEVGGGNFREEHRFSCSVDFDSGRVRSANLDSGGGDRNGDRRGSDQVSGLAVQACQRAVDQRIRRLGYVRVDFGQLNVDDRPGRNDWIVGNARAEGRDRRDSFDFSCSMNLQNGYVRSVDVTRR